MTKTLIFSTYIYSLVINCLIAVMTGRGFSKWAACPQLGISIASCMLLLMHCSCSHDNIVLIIASVILLNLVSFSPYMSRRGILHFFKSSHNDLSCRHRTNKELKERKRDKTAFTNTMVHLTFN